MPMRRLNADPHRDRLPRIVRIGNPGCAGLDLDEDFVSPAACSDRNDLQVIELRDRDGRRLVHDSVNEGALAAILEETLHGVRHELVRREYAAEPTYILVVSCDQARPQRTAFGLAEKRCGAGGYTLDRTRTALDLFDINTGVQ